VHGQAGAFLSPGGATGQPGRIDVRPMSGRENIDAGGRGGLHALSIEQ
jgi:hypothetical protein